MVDRARTACKPKVLRMGKRFRPLGLTRDDISKVEEANKIQLATSKTPVAYFKWVIHSLFSATGPQH